MFGTLSRVFIQGLIALLPIVVTIYVLVLLGWWAEASVRWLLLWVIPEQYYVPGLGMVVGFGVIFVFGLLLNAYLIQRVYDLGERLMHRIPVVKSVYGAVKDLLQYFAGAQRQQMNQVVMVRLPHSDQKLLGLVTRQTFEDLPVGLGDEQKVAVYLPMSYQIGGFTVILPRSQVEPIDMSIEDGLRFALTAGVNVDDGTSQTHHSRRDDAAASSHDASAPESGSGQSAGSTQG